MKPWTDREPADGRGWMSTMSPTTLLRRSVVAATLVTALAVSGCGKDSSGAGGARPTTTARLQTVEPTPNEVTGPDVTVKVKLIGAKVVSSTTGKLRGDRGHIHLSLDGKLVSMAYGTTQQLPGLKPGPHSLQAEFVASDHAPFANRVVAAVLFTVR